MARRTTRIALVVLTLLVATGPSALALADAPGSVEGPVDADGTNETLTDGTTTEETLPNATADRTADEPLDPAENDMIGGTLDETNDATTAVTDHSAVDGTAANATDDAVTTGASDATNRTTDAATELGDAASDAANATESATGATRGVDAAADGAETTIDDATDAVTAVNAGLDSLDPAASSLAPADADDSGESSASGSRGDSDPTTVRDDRTGNETAAAGTGGAGAGDATSAASGVDSERPSDRDSPGAPPSGAEAVAGVGALTAVALFPYFTDGLSLASNAGALSAASSPGALRGEFDRLWRFATAFRYSRYDDSDPLDHDTRARLHETVERSPGAYLSAICDRADVAVSTARHHLDVLEGEGLVATAKVRGKRRYFPAHSDDVELAAALEDEETAEVLRALARLGDSHGGRLADELDRDPSTVSHHLSRLEDAGLVEREREGRAVVNRLAPDVRAVLGDEADEDGDATDKTPAIAD